MFTNDPYGIEKFWDEYTSKIDNAEPCRPDPEPVEAVYVPLGLFDDLLDEIIGLPYPGSLKPHACNEGCAAPVHLVLVEEGRLGALYSLRTEGLL